MASLRAEWERSFRQSAPWPSRKYRAALAAAHVYAVVSPRRPGRRGRGTFHREPETCVKHFSSFFYYSG